MKRNKNDNLDAFHILDDFCIERFTPSSLKEEKYLTIQHLTQTQLQLIEQLVRTKKHFTENIYYKFLKHKPSKREQIFEIYTNQSEQKTCCEIHQRAFFKETMKQEFTA